jgi:hypothetical protein
VHQCGDFGSPNGQPLHPIADERQIDLISVRSGPPLAVNFGNTISFSADRKIPWIAQLAPMEQIWRQFKPFSWYKDSHNRQ